ncbi:hypothetical protein [Blastococcus atacamensis]|uniref:hypothetical protein n=1 Tax=Blastococcus atacamensis TaxID=2070508 RepID=UPI0012FFE895|nr:hypothetical protein [Blastococcus atacamensis]
MLRQRTSWLLEPLADAGLHVAEIEQLVSRLGFEAVVGDGPGFDRRVLDLAGDRPVDVRTAWVETVRRMTELRTPGG